MNAITKPAALALRPMHDDDVLTVLAVERESYGFPWSEGIFRDCLRVGYCCWVAETEEGLGGYAIMQVGAAEAHILNLCVAPRWQCGGVGRRLLEKLLEVAVARNADTALLEVRPSNLPAVHLYHTAGFNQVGVRKAYYPGHREREDALILALDLSVRKT